MYTLHMCESMYLTVVVNFNYNNITVYMSKSSFVESYKFIIVVFITRLN